MRMNENNLYGGMMTLHTNTGDDAWCLLVHLGFTESSVAMLSCADSQAQVLDIRRGDGSVDLKLDSHLRIACVQVFGVFIL